MRTSLPLIAAALLLGAALPAMAVVHQIGAVNVSADHYTDVTWTQFEGPVTRLSFVPNSDNVDCDHITVTYRDGTSHNVFSGPLLKNSRETITFPEGDSRIKFVDFSCKADNIDGARIGLFASSEGDAWTEQEDNWDRTAHVRTGATSTVP